MFAMLCKSSFCWNHYLPIVLSIIFICTKHVMSLTVTPLKPAFQLTNVNQELLDAVADRISYDYLQIALELGFSFQEVEQFRIDHAGIVKRSRAMLTEWYTRHTNESRAKIGWLANALLNTGRSEIEVLVEMEEKASKKSRPSNKGHYR